MPIYELRTYHAHEGKLDEVVARFRDHTVALLDRHNLKSVGYWVPQDPPLAASQLIYIVEHPNRQDAEKNWATFIADPDWQRVKAESEANGPLVAKIDRLFLNPTDFSALK